MRSMRSVLIGFPAALVLVVGSAVPAAAAEYRKINGAKTVVSANSGVWFTIKSGRCEFQAKFSLYVGGVGTGGGADPDLWLYGKLASYPTINGKPNCQVNYSAQLYNWTTDSWSSIDIDRSILDGHTAADYSTFVARDLGDIAHYKGLTIRDIEVSVSDHSTANWDTLHFFRPYDTRMCSPNGSKPLWNCGYYLVGTQP